MFRLLRLEDRIVLDGAVASDIDDFNDVLDGLENSEENDDDGDLDVPLPGGALDTPPERVHVLVVSSEVDDAEDPDDPNAISLSGAAKEGVKVVSFDTSDTLDVLAKKIGAELGEEKADSIAFATHNDEPAQLNLAGKSMTADSLGSDADQAEFWAEVGGYIKDGGRIDLLGCNIADDSGEGENFLNSFETASGVNIAASIDKTGNEAFGGNWVLEKQSQEAEDFDGIDLKETYFDANLLKNFDGTLYEGQDPDAGYTDIYDRTVPAGKYSFIPVPTDTWQDEEGTTNVSLTFQNVPTWMSYSASSEGFWVRKPDAGESATVTIVATDGEAVPQQTTDAFTVTAYDPNTATPPTYEDVTTTFNVSEDAVSGTQVVASGDYQIATPAADIVGYTIVSGNPTDGTNEGFVIDASGNIDVGDASLINFNDPYVVNNTHQLVVRAEDNEGVYAFSTVEIQMSQGAQDYVVDLTVSPTTVLEEDPNGDNTAQFTVSISPTPITSSVTVNLDFSGSGVNPADVTGPAADFTVNGTSVEFTVGGDTSQVITLEVDNDGSPEPDETFTLGLSLAAGAPANYSINTEDLQTEFTIIDGSKPTLDLSIDPNSFNENSSAVLRATLAGGTLSADTQVQLSFSDTDAIHGSTAAPGTNDYVSPSVITINAGQTSGTITLDGVVDNLDEGGSESFSISVVDDPLNPFNIGAGTANGTITDVIVELPYVELEWNKSEIFEGESFQLTARLVDDTGASVTAPPEGISVFLNTTLGDADPAGVDFSVLEVIEIAGNASSETVNVYGVADGIPESNEVIGIGVRSNATEYQLDPLVGPTQLSVVLKDVVTPVVTLQGGTATITEDPVESTVVRAVQSATSEASTTVEIGVSGTPAADRGVDYTAVYTSDNSPVATQPDGDWTVVIPVGDTQAGIRITAIDDNTFDGTANEQVVLTAKSAGTNLIGSLNTATVEIIDADSGDIPTVELFVWDGSQTVASGSLDEAPGDLLNGRVKLPTAEGSPVPVTVYLTPNSLLGSPEAGTDYALYSDPGGAVTIPMEDIGGGVMAWPVTIGDGFNKANFYVGGLGDDNIFEGTETFQLSIEEVVNGTAGAADTITAAINDATTAPVINLGLSPNAVHELASEGVNTATLSINLTPAPGTTFGTGEVTVTLDQIGGVAGFTAATEEVDYTLFESGGTSPAAYDTTAGEWAVTLDLAGGTTAAGDFTLAGVPDEAAEGTEGFELEASIVSTSGTSTDSVTGIVIDDAAANALTVTLDPITTASITEGVGSAQVGISLSRVYNDDLVVTFSVGGDADPENDYFVEYADGTGTVTESVASTGVFEFTIAAGSGTQAGFSVKAVNDGIVEPDEDFSLQITDISADRPPNDFTQNVETVTIVDGLPLPEVSLYWKDVLGNRISAKSFSENSGGTLYAGISTPVSEDIVVDLTYSTEPALFGLTQDYYGLSTITISAEATEGFVGIQILDDDLYEPTDETFTITLAGVSGPAVNNTADQVTGTITPSDLDGPVQVFLDWQNTGAFTEGNTGEDSIIVQLDRDTHETDLVATLEFSTAATIGDAEFGTDFDVETAGVTISGTGQLTVTIPVGQTQAIVPLQAFADTLNEPNETFEVDIVGLSGGLVGATPPEELGGTQVLTGTIIDTNPDPSISIELIQNTVVIEDGGPAAAAEIRAVIDNGVEATQDITVTLEVTDGTGPNDATLGSDFDGAPATLELTIPAGSMESGQVDDLSGIFRIVPLSDLTFENDEDLQVGISDAVTAGGITIGFDATPLTVTIQNDDDAPTVSLTPSVASMTEGDPGVAGVSTIDLVLSGSSYETVSVDVRLTGSALFEGSTGDDYTLTVDGVTIDGASLAADGGVFTAEFSGGVAGSIPIVFTAVSDSDIEPDELIFSQIVSVDGGAVAASSPDDTARVTIMDDDLEPVFIDLDLENNEGLASPTANITENSNTFLGPVRTATLDVNLVDNLGGAASLPSVIGNTTVVLSLGGEAMPDGADFDYQIATDPLFSNVISVTTAGTFEVSISQGDTTTRLYIRGNDDDIYELEENFIVQAVSADTAEVSSGVADTLVTGLITDNDEAPTVTLTSVNPADVTEGNATEFILTFNGRSSVDTEVNLEVGSTMPGEASFPADYTLGAAGYSFSADTVAKTFSFTIPGNELVTSGATFAVTAYTDDDLLYDPDETITLKLVSGTDYSVGTTDTQTAIIADNDEAPYVSLGSPLPGGTLSPENGGTAQISVLLVDELGVSVTSGIDTVVTIDLAGDATPAETTPETGDDYTVEIAGTGADFSDADTFTVTIPAGDTRAIITLTGLDDTLFERDETINLQVVSSDQAQVSSGVGVLSQTVIIEDDDPTPGVTLFWQTGTIAEDGGSDVLFAQLSSPADVDAIVTLSFVTGSGFADYTPGSAFTAGDDVTDLTNNSNTITIQAGDTRGSLRFWGIDDNEYEADSLAGIPGESLAVDATQVEFVGITTVAPTVDPVTAVVVDDPANLPQVTLDFSLTEVSEGDNSIVTISRGQTLGVDTVVTVTFTAATMGPGVTDGDFTFDAQGFSEPATSYTVNIPGGQSSVTLPFTAVSDGVFEPNEVVFVELAVDENGTLGADTTETVTILDNGIDTPVISLEDQAAGGIAGGTLFAEAEFTQGAVTFPNTATFSVSLDTAAFDDRLITLQLSGAASPTVGPDFTVEVDADGTLDDTYTPVAVSADGSFQFTMPAGATVAGIRFTGVDDGFYETPEDLTVTIPSTGADGLQISAGADSFTFTLLDDDPAPVVELFVTLDEIPEADGNTNLFAVLKDAATGDPILADTDVVVDLSYGGTASLGSDEDYTTNRTTVTIMEGESLSNPVSIFSMDDTEYEGNETILVSAANITNALPATDVNTDYTTGVDLSVASVTILEDDPGPTVSLAVDTSVIQEANGVAALTLTLSTDSPVDEVIWVKYTTTDDDSLGDGPEDIWGTQAQYDDNDDGDWWPEDYLATDSSGVQQVFGSITVPAGVTLPIASVPATGENAFAITIPMGSLSKTVYLHALDDNVTGDMVVSRDGYLWEKNESFTVSIDANSFPNNLQVDPTDNAATVTIIDDDEALAPNVSLAFTGGTTQYGESVPPTNGTIQINMDNFSNQYVELTLGLNGADDFELGAFAGDIATYADNGDGTVTVSFTTPPVGDTTSLAGTIAFNIVDDGTYEIEEEFGFQILDAKFAKIGTPDIITGTITDEEDLPKITVGISTDGDEIPEVTGGGSATLPEGDGTAGPDFAFIIDKGGVTTSEAVLVDYVISSGVTGAAELGADFTGGDITGTLTLTRDSDAIAIVDLSVLADDLDEMNEDVVITISNARFADSGSPLDGAITGPGDVATVTIIDDDATPTLAVDGTLTVDEGAFGTITDSLLSYTDDDSVDDDLIYQVVTAPGHGTLYLGVPGDVTGSVALGTGDFFFQEDLTTATTSPLWYQHDDSETTSDSFIYTVTDETNTSPQEEFNIVIQGLNDPPEVESVIFWIAENTTGEVSNTIDLGGNGIIATDQDGDSLAASSMAGDAAFSLDATTAGELTLNVNTALNYEFQDSYSLLVTIDDGSAPAEEVLVVVNVKDQVEDNPFAAGTVPTPDPILSDSQWTFQIPDSVFPDGNLVTYQYAETTIAGVLPWLNFESDSLTFWYDPAIDTGPSMDATYNIQVVATYYHDNFDIKGQSTADFSVEYDYIASLERSREFFEALDYLEEDEEGYLPAEGDAVEVQEIMVARAVPAEDPAAVEEQPGEEISEILALLDGRPISVDPEGELRADMA